MGAFGTSAGLSLLLAAAGPITALPLVAFGLAVHRLRLSTMGLVQYLTPTGQFLLAVFLYREPFGPAHAAAFGLIWTSLALYSWDALLRSRGAQPEARAAGRRPPGAPAGSLPGPGPVGPLPSPRGGRKDETNPTVSRRRRP